MSRASLALVATVAVAASGASAAAPRRAFLELKTELQPEVAAQTFARVEAAWHGDVSAFVRCMQVEGAEAHPSACATPKKEFQQSCTSVVSAIVQASRGQKEMATSYLEDICSRFEENSVRMAHCHSFSKALTRSMSEDDYVNRAKMDYSAPCSGLWSKFKTQEEQRELFADAAAKAKAKATAQAEKQDPPKLPVVAVGVSHKTKTASVSKNPTVNATANGTTNATAVQAAPTNLTAKLVEPTAQFAAKAAPAAAAGNATEAEKVATAAVVSPSNATQVATAAAVTPSNATQVASAAAVAPSNATKATPVVAKSANTTQA